MDLRRSQEDDTCFVRISIQAELENGKARGIFSSHRTHEHGRPAVEDDSFLLPSVNTDEIEDEEQSEPRDKPSISKPNNVETRQAENLKSLYRKIPNAMRITQTTLLTTV
uniref:Uncharacterized protein n=1 Tax=Ditylenchus dipsaci TaxID=166011 RepID=A0A915DL92_9BILA